MEAYVALTTSSGAARKRNRVLTGVLLLQHLCDSDQKIDREPIKYSNRLCSSSATADTRVRRSEPTTPLRPFIPNQQQQQQQQKQQKDSDV
ncbi:hypothetical protein F2P81_009472 [Scophthalmus maximus]|uniref:Uncharacterized protein n=1 Tax=Scophthalmus maximus TaxID=52904 RepID=A0A6A4T3S2_SCOMX|nr:hypothetical protein F2P81_009472 [Scophthalmus maximus]